MNRAKRSTLASVMSFVVAITATGMARAAEPDTYAVVALVGDEISLVSYRPTVGSSVDQNVRQQVATGDAHFDELATRVALGTLHRALPDALLQGLKVGDGAAYGDSEKLLAADGSLPALIAALRPQLAPAGTHYLVLLSKARGEARLRTTTGSLGSGKLTGLGYYIDRSKRMKSSSTGERGRGFVAPFAYVTVTLIDLRSGAVVRSEQVEETTTRANVGPASDLDPWDALSAEEKLRLLDNLLGRALQRAVAQVVAPA